MKTPQEGRNTGAPSLRALQGRSATEPNGQAAKGRPVSSVAGGWMPENISGIPAGRSVFHLTSPLIGLFHSPDCYWSFNPNRTMSRAKKTGHFNLLTTEGIRSLSQPRGISSRTQAMIEDSRGPGTHGFGPKPISPSAPVVTGSYACSTRGKDVPSKKLHKNSGLIH